MNEMQIFQNNEFGEIRTIEENGKIMFCGSDVAKALGYDQPHKAVERHCNKDGGIFHTVIDSMGREQQAKFINEGNLYRLISHSKLPSAEQFEKWVFDEVLPNIRKTGSYQVQLSREQQVANALILANEMLQGAKLQLEMKEQQINELKPKADYLDRILKSKSLMNITQIAKDYGMSGTEFNKRLYKYGVQYKQRDQWLLYGKHQASGYTSSETIEVETSTGVKTVLSTKWTQKGRLFIYDLLKKDGILPSIEGDE